MSPSDVPGGTTSPDADRDQPLDPARIVQAAVELIEEHGPEKLTLSLIARTLGVTQPALYKHVDGLQGLWREVGLHERRQLRDVLAAACMGRSGADAVREVSHAWCAFASASPGLYAAASHHPVAGDDDLEAAVAGVTDVLEAALQAFNLTADESRWAARALRSALHGYASFDLVTGNPAYTPSDTLEHIVELFVAGVQSLAAGSIHELT